MIEKLIKLKALDVRGYTLKATVKAKLIDKLTIKKVPPLSQKCSGIMANEYEKCIYQLSAVMKNLEKMILQDMTDINKAVDALEVADYKSKLNYLQEQIQKYSKK